MAGIAASYVSTTSFTIAGDKTADFNEGRRCRVTCSSIYKYGTIESSSYSSPNTTVILTANSDDLNSGLTVVYYGVQADSVGSLPTHTHDATEGEGGSISITRLSDTPAAYDTGKYLKSTTSGTEWATAGTSIHSELSNLAYTDSGHTGFQPAGDYATDAELTSTSGTLQTDIDTKLENVVEDLIPELGGDLSCNNYNIENVGKICGNSLSSRVYNDTGSTLTKGTAITICGLHEEICTVCVSDNREIGKMPCCGVIESDVIDGSEGCGIRVGRINMDTSGMTGNPKDRLYVQNDGSLDTTMPPNGMIQRVGFLVKKAAGSAGRICICVRGPRSMYSAKDQHPVIRMGDDVGHQKVVIRDYNDVEKVAFYDNGNLTLSGTVDGVDVAALKVTVDAKPDTLLELSDTPAAYDDTKFLKSTASGVEWDAGTVAHSTLTELDYASAGHTGFAQTLQPVPSVNQSASGDVVTMQVDVNATGFGATLHMDTDGNWIEADADVEATVPCQALALETGTGSKEVLLRGFVRDDTWTWTVGGVNGLIYVSCTAGELTQTTVSGSGDQAQVVGFATHANRMFFNPNYLLIEIS